MHNNIARIEEFPVNKRRDVELLSILLLPEEIAEELTSFVAQTLPNIAEKP